MKNRLDKELVVRLLAPSRSKAQDLITSFLVMVNGNIVSKSNYLVGETDKIEIVTNNKLKYVSRGGLKLEHALEEFKVNVTGLNAMDVGSSTGGFCDCLLSYGINHIVAIDVGTDVMHPSLRNNPKIDLHEQTNFRDLPHQYFENIDIITCDVSFISLAKIVEKISQEDIKVDMICLIKPQFECGLEIAKQYKGVILNKEIHRMILDNILLKMNILGFYLKNITFSPIRGGDGNIEYLAYISNKVDDNIKVNLNKIVSDAFKID